MRYGAPHGLTYSYSEYGDYIDEILRQIISDGKALECNTGDFHGGLPSLTPAVTCSCVIVSLGRAYNSRLGCSLARNTRSLF